MSRVLAKPMACSHKQHGFTLLEVLVALAILAIVMGALIKVTDSYAFNAGYLQQKTLAQWIAENKATEYQLMQQFVILSSGLLTIRPQLNYLPCAQQTKFNEILRMYYYIMGFIMSDVPITI